MTESASTCLCSCVERGQGRDEAPRLTWLASRVDLSQRRSAGPGLRAEGLRSSPPEPPARLHARVYFELDTAVLDASQALCVALPAAGVPAVLLRLGGRSWALVAPASVVASVVAITVASASADVITWVAFLLVPVGCALALGWAAHGARPWLAVLTVVSAGRGARGARWPGRPRREARADRRLVRDGRAASGRRHAADPAQGRRHCHGGGRHRVHPGRSLRGPERALQQRGARGRPAAACRSRRSATSPPTTGTSSSPGSSAASWRLERRPQVARRRAHVRRREPVEPALRCGRLAPGTRSRPRS